MRGVEQSDGAVALAVLPYVDEHAAVKRRAERTA
jgi:enterochelin esterase-like enzyme